MKAKFDLAFLIKNGYTACKYYLAIIFDHDASFCFMQVASFSNKG